MKRVVLSAVMFLTPAVASAATITIDNFESGNLNAWNPVGFGQIAVDPLNNSNHALNFAGLGDGGNIWTASTYAATGNDWWFSFDYLGLPAAGNLLGTGGFIGWDDDTLYAGNERWLAGTPGGGADQPLIDDGAWHHYVIHLTRSGAPNLWPTAVYFKMEDWIHSDAIAGNAYFDNFAITDVPPGAAVPEPASLALLASGLLLIARRLRKSIIRPILGAALVVGLSSTAWASPITVVHTVLVDSWGNLVPGTITASFDLYTRPYGASGSICCGPTGPPTLVDQFSLGIGSDFSVVIPTAIVDTHASWVMPIPTGSSPFDPVWPWPGLNQLTQWFPYALDIAHLYDWCSPVSGGFADGIFIIGLRGGCTYEAKVTNMQLANGVGAIIVNTIPGQGAQGIGLFGFTPGIPVIGLSFERGEQIMAALLNPGADTSLDLVYLDFAARWDPDPVPVATPEPASLALVGVGLAGLALCLRMRLRARPGFHRSSSAPGSARSPRAR